MSDDRLNIDFTIMVDPDFRGSSEEMATVARKFVEYARQSKWPALDALISAIKDFSYFVCGTLITWPLRFSVRSKRRSS